MRLRHSGAGSLTMKRLSASLLAVSLAFAGVASAQDYGSYFLCNRLTAEDEACLQSDLHRLAIRPVLMAFVG